MKTVALFLLTLVSGNIMSCSDGESGVNINSSSMQLEPSPNGTRKVKGSKECSEPDFKPHNLNGLKVEGTRGLQFQFGDFEKDFQRLAVVVYDGLTICRNEQHTLRFYGDEGINIDPFYIKKIAKDQYSLHQKIGGSFTDSLRNFNEDEVYCQDQEKEKCWLSLKEGAEVSSIDTTVRFIDSVTGIEKPFHGKIFLEESPREQILIGLKPPAREKAFDAN